MNLKNYILRKFDTAKEEKKDEIVMQCQNKDCEDWWKRNKNKFHITFKDNGKLIYHCFRCGISGNRVDDLKKLLGIIDYNLVDKIRELFHKKKQISKFSETIMANLNKEKDIKNLEEIKLPESVLASKSKLAMNYLKSREIGIQEILKYNIGYCSKGKYENRLIFPFFIKEKNNGLFAGYNYFQARSILYDDSRKVKNPKSERSDLFYNWWGVPDNTESLILVEGIFDCITIDLPNCIAINGKQLTPGQKQKILSLPELKKVTVMLDYNPSINDLEKDTWDICNFAIKNGKRAFVVNLGQYGKDANKIGRSKSRQAIADAVEVSMQDIFFKKINNNLTTKKE